MFVTKYFSEDIQVFNKNFGFRKNVNASHLSGQTGQLQYDEQKGTVGQHSPKKKDIVYKKLFCFNSYFLERKLKVNKKQHWGLNKTNVYVTNMVVNFI